MLLYTIYSGYQILIGILPGKQGIFSPRFASKIRCASLDTLSGYTYIDHGSLKTGMSWIRLQKCRCSGAPSVLADSSKRQQQFNCKRKFCSSCVSSASLVSFSLVEIWGVNSEGLFPGLIPNRKRNLGKSALRRMSLFVEKLKFKREDYARRNCIFML